MSGARVTQAMQAAWFVRSAQDSYAKVSKAQQQVTTGHRIDTPSDDPYGTQLTLGYKAQIGDNQQFQRNVSNASGSVQTAESSMQDVQSNLTSVWTNLVQANNGTMSAADKQAFISTLQQVKEQLRTDANATFDGKSVFAGTATGTAPYPAGSNAYAGNTNSIDVRIAPNQTITTNQNGEQVFGVSAAGPPATANVFDTIDQVIADLGSGADLGADIDAVKAHMDRVAGAQAVVGATMNRLTSAASALQQQGINLESARSGVQDIDAAAAITEFQQASTAYQAALSVGSRLMQTTILDYLGA